MSKITTATGGIPGATTSLENWSVEGNYVERLMDNAAFMSAHPENTLVLAGPARKDTILKEADDFLSSLLPIGMVQQFNFGQGKPVTPVMGIGSSRTFFLTGKSQSNFRIGRLFINGRNLLRVLTTQAIQAGIPFQDLKVMPVSEEGFLGSTPSEPDYPFICNLDSELFALPFGLGVLFKDKAERFIGGFYLELCTINSWNISFAAGQNMIAEDVSGVLDRVVPLVPPTLKGPGHPEIAKLEGTLGLGDKAANDGYSVKGDKK